MGPRVKLQWLLNDLVLGYIFVLFLLQVFEVIREIAPNIHTMTTDFERGIWEAAKKVWPNITIEGCAFHWANVSMIVLSKFWNLDQINCILHIKFIALYSFCFRRCGRKLKSMDWWGRTRKTLRQDMLFANFWSCTSYPPNTLNLLMRVWGQMLQRTKDSTNYFGIWILGGKQFIFIYTISWQLTDRQTHTHTHTHKYTHTLTLILYHT